MIGGVVPLIRTGKIPIAPDRHTQYAWNKITPEESARLEPSLRTARKRQRDTARDRTIHSRSSSVNPSTSGPPAKRASRSKPEPEDDGEGELYSGPSHSKQKEIKRLTAHR